MTTLEIKPIDAIQVAALRKADTIVFHHRERQSYIRAIKRNAKTERNPFADDVEIVVPCETRFTSYEKDETSFYPMPDFTAFDMLHSPQYDEGDWQTIASFLKVGDVLTLYWCRGSMNTQNADDAGWCGDYLKLQIKRGDKKFSFHVAHCFVPRGSTARMIKDVRARQKEYTIAA